GQDPLPRQSAVPESRAERRRLRGASPQASPNRCEPTAAANAPTSPILPTKHRSRSPTDLRNGATPGSGDQPSRDRGDIPPASDRARDRRKAPRLGQTAQLD